MPILSFVSRNWLSAIGLLSFVELVNQYHFGSNKVVFIAVSFIIIGLFSSFVVPKSG